MALFRVGRYFDAHEVLETDCWLGLPLSAEKLFFQGFIQLCAAFVHGEKGNAYGFHKKAAQAYRKLDGVWVLYGKPATLAGVEMPELLNQLAGLMRLKE
ncbi:MAG: DUF309 domain-containing protein [Candidatus Melainabacteria bacterium]|nr:DUF309 domain-containing protein [Candidatus Melainabacteria bacterium]